MKNGIIIVLSIVIFGTSMWGYDQYEENKKQSIFIENQFQRMFNDAVIDVEDIQVNLSKTMITGIPKQNIMLFTEITQLCYDAQEKLAQLPFEHGKTSKITKFLNQVGDLSVSLAKKNLEGKVLSREEKNTLEELHNYSNYLSQELIGIQGEMLEKGVKIGDLRKKISEELKDVDQHMLATSFLNIEEKIQKYPKLIYDGPFSEHIKTQKAKIAKESKVGKEEAKRIAKEFIENGEEYEVAMIEENDKSRMPVYLIGLKNKKEEAFSVTVGITKAGGHIMWMLDTRNIKDHKLLEEEGVEIAQNFLNKKGYKNMQPTYFIKYDGQMLINFAYMQDETIIYTDLIKVKVGMDDGRITGFEADGYLFNHHRRSEIEPKISIIEAKSKISMDAEVSEPRLSIIPTEGGKEALCYEFKAKYKGDVFFIYINAKTGEEQKILQKIVKDEGVLMI